MPFNVPENSYAESLVMFELDAKYYWRENGKEIDALKDSVPVEVKFKSKIDKQDTKCLDYFIKRYGEALNVTKGYIITKDAEGSIGSIKLVPLWRFCLEGI